METKTLIEVGIIVWVTVGLMVVATSMGKQPTEMFSEFFNWFLGFSVVTIFTIMGTLFWPLLWLWQKYDLWQGKRYRKTLDKAIKEVVEKHTTP
jgi:hypothetical protein